MDLTPAGFAAQARELVRQMVAHTVGEEMPTDWYEYPNPSPDVAEVRRLADAIAAALGAVCDAAHAERDAEIAHVVADHETEHAMQESYIEDLIKERDRLAEEVRQLREAIEKLSRPPLTFNTIPGGPLRCSWCHALNHRGRIEHAEDCAYTIGHRALVATVLAATEPSHG